MSDDPSRHLEQELADERALRSALERRLATEVERVKLWRTRAEERADRIERLETAGPLSRLVRAVRQRAPGTSPEASAPDSPEPSKARPAFPVVRVGAAVHSRSIRPVIDTMTAIPLDGPETDPARALTETDLVVIEPDVVAELSAEVQERVQAWAETRGRPPLVIWEAGEGSAPPRWLLEAATVAVTTRPDRIQRLLQAWGREVGVLGPTFDPGVHNPRRDVELPSVPLASVPLDEGIPDVEVVWSAARGVPSDSAPHGVEDPRLAAASRRWAYRLHAPWVRASELLALAGVDAPNPIPTVAGLLVTKRPDRVNGAIEAFFSQTHSRKELVVGLHGIEADLGPVLESAPIPVTVLRFPSDRPLGACLNDTAAVTGAGMLAKIDDDDHYGPGHVEDAVHALRYTGAGIVGKSAMFVYLRDKGRTVLRRSGDEERMILGTMPGGTLVMHRRVWDAVRFPHRPRSVDVLFLQGAREVGEQVYSNSRWEFCLVRGDEGHTYRTEPDTFLAGAEEAWAGHHPDRVEVTIPAGGHR